MVLRHDGFKHLLVPVHLFVLLLEALAKSALTVLETILDGLREVPTGGFELL